MFGSKQRKIDALELENAELIDEVQSLKDRINRLISDDEQAFKATQELHKCSFSFDWNRGQAFSIERMYENVHKIPFTVIGYIKEEDKRVGEWKFYCSQEEHERLVKDFNDSKKKTK